MKISKLILGTAQLGMDYGINNEIGRPKFEESKTIINTALENGINTFDTAPEYGTSEKILGDVIVTDKNKEVIFISKVPPVNWNQTKDKEDVLRKIKEDLQKTLFNLNIDKIPIYLFHRFRDMTEKDGFLLDELVKLKRQGKIGKIGVSIYSPDEAEEALTLNKKGIEVIQIPFNMVDKRLLENGFLEKARSKDIIVIARSVFLQGLFFKQKLPEHLQEFEKYQKALKEISLNQDISVGELALRYVLSTEQIDGVIIGVEKKEQLIQNLMFMKKGALEKEVIEKINLLGSASEKIINPTLWKR